MDGNRAKTNCSRYRRLCWLLFWLCVRAFLSLSIYVYVNVWFGCLWCAVMVVQCSNPIWKLSCITQPSTDTHSHTQQHFRFALVHLSIDLSDRNNTLHITQLNKMSNATMLSVNRETSLLLHMLFQIVVVCDALPIGLLLSSLRFWLTYLMLEELLSYVWCEKMFAFVDLQCFTQCFRNLHQALYTICLWPD